MKRAVTVAVFVAIALILLLISAYGLMTGAYGPKDVALLAFFLLLEGLFDALGTRFFWLFVLVSLAALLVFAKRRKWARLKTVAAALGWLAVAFVVTWVWLLLVVNGPLFNFLAPLTGEFRVYSAECKGWLLRSERIGGAGTCYGFYKFLGGSSTYKVDVSHQKVWIWQEEPIEVNGRWGTNGGWVALTQANPDVRKNCEVRDYSNWACTDSDQYGTSISQLVGGREHHYEYGKPNPSDAFLNAFASLARCDVQVDALTFWRLWAGPFGILGYRTVEAMPEKYSFRLRGDPKWIDCTNPPP